MIICKKTNQYILIKILVRVLQAHSSHSSKIVKNGDFSFYIQAFKLVQMFDIKYAIPKTIFELILSRR